jgi:hypothetical protein
MSAARHACRVIWLGALALAASHAWAAAAAGKPVAASRATVTKPAVATIHATEQAIEVAMDQLRLPDGATGAVLIQACARCAMTSLSLDTQSRIFLDGKAISLDTLRQRVNQHKRLMATALYASADMRLTRLLVFSR